MITYQNQIIEFSWSSIPWIYNQWLS